MDVPNGEYIVFEHGPFDFETESQSVEAKIENEYSDNISMKSLIRCGDETHKNVEAFAERVFNL